MNETGFWTVAQACPERTAIVDDHGDTTSYGDLLAAQNRTANGLLALGLRPGDTVAAVLWNQPEFLELALACMQSGLYFLPLNTHLSSQEVTYVLEDSGARVLVATQRTADVATGAAAAAGLPKDRLFSVGQVAGFRDWGHLKAGQPHSRPQGSSAGEIMVYTSGTTGRPKGVRRPLSGQDPDASGTTMGRFVQFFCGVGPDEPHAQLVTGPMYHTTPGGLAIAALHLGHTLVLMDRWEPLRTLDLLEQHGVSYLHVVPTMFHRLLSLPEAERSARDLSALRTVLHGAAPCPVEVKRRMIEWLGPVITEYYGSSEGGGTLVRSSEWLERPGTVGLPWPGSSIQVLDEGGEPCKPGESGTVYMQMSGWDFSYHNDAGKTRDSTRDGYFTVGDIGHLDDDGYLFLSGRTAELIISGGTNIYPAEIEGCLLSHPAVADAAVIGIPNEEWGEEVKAVVQLRPGMSPGDELAADLVAHCRTHLAGFKVPRSVEFRDALPRTEAGKLLKRLLS